MQTWVAVCLLIGQGIFLLIGWRMVKRFGDYVDVLVAAQSDNLSIRRNLATQQNEAAIAEVLHTHRRKDDPPLIEEKEA